MLVYSIGFFGPPGVWEILILAICFGSFAAIVAVTVFLVVRTQQRKAENLLPCPDCGHWVSPLAESCPKCGRPMK
jgi:hypothetical protein